MTALQDIESKLASLSRAEKAQLLKWVAQDLEGAFSGIDKPDGVAGGDACTVRTRIPIWLLVHAKKMGASEASLLESYPSLRAEDLTNAWAYARTYPNEIEQAILANEDA